MWLVIRTQYYLLMGTGSQAKSIAYSVRLLRRKPTRLLTEGRSNIPERSSLRWPRINHVQTCDQG